LDLVPILAGGHDAAIVSDVPLLVSAHARVILADARAVLEM